MHQRASVAGERGVGGKGPVERLVIKRPDDFHLHVRDGRMLECVVPHSSALFGRCIIMPNTVPPITTLPMAEAYRQRIQRASRSDSAFEPLMTLYLTDSTTVETVLAVKESPHVMAFKLYPAGATTNSENGVTDMWKLLPVFKAMAAEGVPLLVHGEVTDPTVDIFDREKMFIERIMVPLLDCVPDLKVVMEHITTKDAVEFVQSSGPTVAASITPQHITMNRNDLFKGGLRPHHYCLPVLKREEHRRAVLGAATSGNPKFFLGTDSAPHAKHMKESSCGCAGIFSAPVAMSVYAEAFEQAGTLDKLEGFSSINGALFYGLQPSEETIELQKEDWSVPDSYSYEDTHLIPLRAGQTLRWKPVNTIKGTSKLQ